MTKDPYSTDPAAIPATPDQARGNRLLADLHCEDRELLSPHLQPVPLAARGVLFEPGDEVTHAHFPTGGAVVSLLCVMEDGRVAEAAMVGGDGVVGAVVSEGQRPTSVRGVVLIPGSALRIETARLAEIRRASPRLRQHLDLFANALLAQVLQSAACNALHGIEERTCRWLIAVQDRSGTDALPLTQEHIAELLGVQRTTVTRVLADLAAAGAIEPRRGRIVIKNRARLLAGACECHRALRRHLAACPPPPAPIRPRPRLACLG